MPILAVDFSIGNIVEMDQGIPTCLHSRKPGYPNEYVQTLLAISKSMRQYSKFMLGYGVGARTMPGLGSASELCSMTGDFIDPFIESQEELLNSYEGTLGAVKIAGPVNYKPIV